MKIELVEYEGCFAFECSAETVVDASLLARLGLQAEHTDTNFFKDNVVATVLLQKPAKRRRDWIRRAK